MAKLIGICNQLKLYMLIDKFPWLSSMFMKTNTKTSSVAKMSNVVLDILCIIYFFKNSLFGLILRPLVRFRFRHVR